MCQKLYKMQHRKSGKIKLKNMEVPKLIRLQKSDNIYEE